jgi:hypothetical protein
MGGRRPERIVSGGQTGADRAALDWAIANGVPHGGWCPKGRRAEDGEIPGRYELRETDSDTYEERTRLNVRDSDGTVIFSIAADLKGGSAVTELLARELGRPVLHLSWTRNAVDAADRLREFVEREGIRTLNVAGPRATGEADVGEFVRETLTAAFPDEARPPVTP